MVGAEDHDVSRAHRCAPHGHGCVHLDETRGEPPDVVAVAPDLVEIDEIGEQQAVIHLPEMTRAGGDAGRVVGGVIVHVDAALCEDLADLADAHYRHPPLVQKVEVRGRRRFEREIAPARGTLVAP